MNSFRLDALRATNEKRPGGNRGATEDVTNGLAAVRNWNVQAPFRIAAGSKQAELCLMPSQHETVVRARAVRGRLLAVARACAELGVPLPERAKLAEAIGCTPRQIARYMALLIADGVVERRTWKWRMADMSDFPPPLTQPTATCVAWSGCPLMATGCSPRRRG